MKDRIAKAEYLYRELGNINDRYLNEALTYRPRTARSPRLLLIAACLCLSALFVFGTVMISKRNDSKEDEDALALSVDVILDGAPDGALDSTLPANAPALVWQSGEDGVLCVYELTEAEFARLTRQMQGSHEVGEHSPEMSYRFWIVSADGTVRTPYLKSSDGNIGTTLFDYEVEVMPDQAFLDCLSDILN